jgi:hypothetical protein
VGAKGEDEGGNNRVRQGGRREKRGGLEKATREENKKRYKVKIEIHKARHEKEVWVHQGRQGPHPNQ